MMRTSRERVARPEHDVDLAPRRGRREDAV
jgi:hypothetical protein